MKLLDLMPLAKATLVVAFATPAALVALAAPAARAQTTESSAPYLVTYFEVTPSAKTTTTNMLRHLAAASRAEAGNLRYEILEEAGRPAQYAILETWKDAKALEAHANGAAM